MLVTDCDHGHLEEEDYFWPRGQNVYIWSSFSDMISMIPKKIYDKYISIYIYIAVDPGSIRELPILKQGSLNDPFWRRSNKQFQIYG